VALERKKKEGNYMTNWILDKIYKLKNDLEELRQNRWFAVLEFVFYIVVLILSVLVVYNYFR